MDHLARSLCNCFAAGSLDRLGVRRQDEAWVEQRLLDAGTRIVPLYGLRHLATIGEVPSVVTLAPSGVVRELLARADVLVLLGGDGEQAVFAAALAEHDASLAHAVAAAAPAAADYRELRELGPLPQPTDAAILCHGRAMVHWHRRHRFCSDCGAPTRSIHAGHQRVCTALACGQSHFPRTDAAVIMLVTSDGEDGEACLLGRQRNWPPRVYSALAGFVEPGESLEATVRREVLEEAGVVVEEVSYHSSQPWPFPASLMLGFTARASSRRIMLHDQELEDARWFTRAALTRAMVAGEVRPPGRLSIAYRLLEDWFDGAGQGSLADIGLPS